MDELKERWKVIVTVSDTGTGIPPDKLEEIFRPFTQADTSFTRKHGGTGLGLTITQRIAEALGGEVTVRSELGKGSQFVLKCYVDKVDPVKIRPVHESQIGAVPSYEGKLSGRVLLAEDGFDNRRLMTLILERAGAKVEVAENGQVVLEKLGSAHYDLVLMDVQMPVMDGLQAATEIRKRKNMVPIIAVTAYAMQRDEGMCLKAGCDDFISKPIEPNVLLHKVAKWLKAGKSLHVTAG
jgi:CheY-like chemotaxis protein